MYAVMRFGKSFTSLCCALKMKAKTVLVVSAKADVKDEWKKTVESAGNFSDYVFIESSDLLTNENVISEKQTPTASPRATDSARALIRTIRSQA